MDQPQDTYPKAVQDLISQLTKEAASLKDENEQLQSQLSGGNGSGPRSYDDLLEEIDDLKAELEDRPSEEEVDVLKEKIQKHKLEKKTWRQSTGDLSSQLYEAEAARYKEEGLKEELEWEIEKLRNDLKEKAQEKEEALARLQSQRPDTFNIREFLLGESPPRPNPITVTMAEGRKIRARKDKFVFPVKEAGAIKWAHKGGRFVVSLPSVIYNGKTQLTEPHRGNIITDFSYEVFKADKPELYYGTYRCIKKVTVDWDVLASFGQEFVASFLDRVVVEKDFAAPAITSLVQNMYKSGFLKAECLAFQCEGPK